MIQQPENNHLVEQPLQDIAYPNLAPSEQRQRLTELAKLFLRLGTIAFGGPAAHIAMMDREVVDRYHWMSREALLDLLGITHLIPGPNSTELAIHIGYARAGWRGLLIAGSCFILPAMLLVWALAVVYDRTQTVPAVAGLLYGIKPVIMAIVLQAVWNLGKKATQDTPTRIVGVVTIAAYLMGWNEILLLLLSGLTVMVIKNWRRSGTLSGAVLPLSGLLAQGGDLTPAIPTTSSVSGFSVFLFFLKIGAVLYGSGYVLLAFLQRDLVERNHWLTSQQLLDAVAIGQLTPGPVFTTATFIGYLLAGNIGAIAGTIGIFLPAFVLVWVVNPWVPKLRQSPQARGFLDGVNAASWGLMAGVSYTLGRSALVDWLTVVVAILSAVVVFRFKINSAWLVLAGGAIGLASQFIGV